MMKSYIKISTLLCLLVVSNIATAQLTILAGLKGGSYFELAKDIKSITNVPIDVKTSNGSFANLKDLGDGNLALIQYDVLLSEHFKDLQNGVTTIIDSSRVMFPFGMEEIHLITKSSIRTMKELKGKKVAIGTDDQGTTFTAKSIKEIIGAEWIDVDMTAQKAIGALLKGEIDGFFVVGFAPYDILNAFTKLPPQLKSSIHLLSINDTRLDKNYTKTSIKTGTYDWAKYEVETYAVKTLLITTVAQNPVHKQELEQLLVDIKKNIGNLQKKGHPSWKHVDFSFKELNWDIYEASKKVFNLK